MTLLLEHWKPVLSLETYEVSDLGRIRHARTKRIRKLQVDKDGYLEFVGCHHGKKFKRRVHCLVAIAFIGPRPGGHDVNHKDTIKSNCRADNLEYLTHKANFHHARDLGLMNGFSRWKRPPRNAA